MENLSSTLQKELKTYYFPKLHEMLKAYHNAKTKISVGNRINIIKDNKRPKSLILGVRSPFFLAARKDKTLNPHLTKHTQLPGGFEIYKLIYEIIGMIYPEFEFNQIIINFNTIFKPHVDRSNKNEDSFMLGIGDYDYGRIKLFDDASLKTWKIVDIKNKPLLFSGKTTWHGTEHYTGDRYCIVAYQTKTKYHYDPFERQLHALV